MMLHKYKILLIGLGAFLIVFLVFLFGFKQSIEISFDLDNPDRVHSGTIYYDTGEGFCETNRIDFSYKDSKVKLKIANTKHIDRLRYDPMDSTGKIIIRNIQVNGHPIESEKLVLKPLHAIASIKNIGEGSYQIESNGNDPYLILAQDLSGYYHLKSVQIDYFLLSSLAVLLIFVFFCRYIVLRKIENISKIKKFIFSYLTLFMFITIVAVLYKLDFDFPQVSLGAKILFFDRFLEEYILVSLLVYLLLNRYSVFFFLGLMICTAYILITFSQIVSLFISGEFLTKLALSNVEFIGFMLTFENILTVVVAIVGIIIVPAIVAYKLVSVFNHWEMSNRFFLFLFLVGVFNHYNYKVMTKKIKQQRNLLYNQNHMFHEGTVGALIRVLKRDKTLNIHFTQDEIKKINSMGFVFNPTVKYPFQKKSIYQEHKFQHEIKPNIIIIFTEGYSARTCNVYNSNFPGLTPHLVDFANNEHTMVVKNYFNHTAATYRGLHGQLCSLYPKYGGVGGWHDNIQNLPKVNYKSLAHLLKNNGYTTIWLNMHYKNASSNDEMIAHFGFDRILSAETLLKNYSDNKKGKRKDFLTDQSAYSILIEYLKDLKTSKPFFLGMYTVETHAWIDTLKNGIKYRDGKFNGLNTIHNMDNAFGKFWKFFKNSKFAKNTIIVFTSDHAHFYEKSYIKAMKTFYEDDYKKIFVDKIPLLIYDPVNKLPKAFIANNATSVDLAPTLSQLLDIKNEKNAFMGTSIWEESEKHIGLVSIGGDTYLVKNSRVYDDFDIKKDDVSLLDLMKRFMQYTHQIEVSNRLIDEK